MVRVIKMALEQQDIQKLTYAIFNNTASITRETEMSILRLVEEHYLVNPKEALLLARNLIIGNKSQDSLNKLFSFTKITLKQPSHIALKNLEFLINENAKIANQSISLMDLMVNLIFNTNYAEVSTGVEPEFKLQANALHVVIALSRQCPKLVHSHWLRFLPPRQNQQSLMTIVAGNPSPLVRSAALKLMEQFFSDQNTSYLQVAKDGKASSFVSQSQQLADICAVALESVIDYIKGTNNSEFVLKVYFSLNLMIKVCPLGQLRGDFVSTICEFLTARMDLFSEAEDCAILECLSTAILKFKMPQHAHLVSKPVQIVLKLANNRESKQLTLACFKLMKSLTEVVPIAIWNKIAEFNDLFNSASESEELLHGYLTFIEQFAHSATKHSQLEQSIPNVFWLQKLDFVMDSFTVDSNRIKVICVQVLANISDSILSEMDSKKLLNFIEGGLLLLERDDNTKATVCGCFSALVVKPKLQTQDLIGKLSMKLDKLLKEETTNVRSRAMHTVAELSSVIISSNMKLKIDDATLEQLFVGAVQGCKDVERVKINAVRVLGNIVQMFTPELMQKNTSTLILTMELMQKNIQNGTFKSRWNACYCIRNMLKNIHFPIGNGYEYSPKLYECLCQVAIESTNFKVRTSALAALATPKSIEKYGKVDGVLNLLSESLKACAASIESMDNALARVSRDDKKYVQKFLSAVESCVSNFKAVVQKSELDWTRFVEIENQINLLVVAAQEPKKSAFRMNE